MENIMGTTNKGKKNKDSGKRRRVYAVAAILLAVVCVCCFVWMVCYVMGLKRAEDKMDAILESYVFPMEESLQSSALSEETDVFGHESIQSDVSESEESLSAEPDNETAEAGTLGGYELPYQAVNIAALQEKENKDIYAWISIPGTAIDYPVLQHPEEMDYYLEFNIDGTKGYPGCIYTQRLNSKDWMDKNTVLYGHNMKNGTMFAGLHNYEDSQFFEENPYIYIYTEDGRILVYQIFAAYEYSDAHLLMAVSTRTDESFQVYLDSIFENDGLNDHFNRELELTPQDKLITLSTCISSKPTRRWLVQGVLIEEGEQVAED